MCAPWGSTNVSLRTKGRTSERYVVMYMVSQLCDTRHTRCVVSATKLANDRGRAELSIFLEIVIVIESLHELEHLNGAMAVGGEQRGLVTAPARGADKLDGLAPAPSPAPSARTPSPAPAPSRAPATTTTAVSAPGIDTPRRRPPAAGTAEPTRGPSRIPRREVIFEQRALERLVIHKHLILGPDKHC